jgi:hypothetical protein
MIGADPRHGANGAGLFDLPPTRVRHPARYSAELLPVLVDALRGCRRILDPFGGVGGIFKLEPFLPGCEIAALEIEPEWAAQHPRTTLGNALALPWPDGYFDGICTSPCYGNRMADHHAAHDASRRNTYRHTLGRPLHPDNAGALQWGDAYRDFHLRAWMETRRVLQPGGRFVLNVKDHIRAGARQPVTAWHIDALAGLGLALVDRREIVCPGQRFGQNGERRIECESVLLFVLGGACVLS